MMATAPAPSSTAYDYADIDKLQENISDGQRAELKAAFKAAGLTPIEALRAAGAWAGDLRYEDVDYRREWGPEFPERLALFEEFADRVPTPLHPQLQFMRRPAFVAEIVKVMKARKTAGR